MNWKRPVDLLVVSCVFALIWLATIILIPRMFSSTLKISREMLDKQLQINEQLLNRLQAGDLQTYLRLQSQESTSEPSVAYVSAHDLQELARIQGAATGLGDFIYDDSTDRDELLD